MQDLVGWLDILHLVVVVGVSELAVMVVVVWVSESSVGSELVELVMCQVRLGELRVGSELVELVMCQVRLACPALKFFFSPKNFHPPGPRAKPHTCAGLSQPLNFISHLKNFFTPQGPNHMLLVQLGVSHTQTSGDSSLQRKTEMPNNKNSMNRKLNNYKSGKNIK
jgi:hypothetical protein